MQRIFRGVLLQTHNAQEGSRMDAKSKRGPVVTRGQLAVHRNKRKEQSRSDRKRKHKRGYRDE